MQWFQRKEKSSDTLGNSKERNKIRWSTALSEGSTGLYGRVMSIKECQLFPASLGIVLERSQRKPQSNRNQLLRTKLTRLRYFMGRGSHCQNITDYKRRKVIYNPCSKTVWVSFVQSDATSLIRGWFCFSLGFGYQDLGRQHMTKKFNTDHEYEEILRFGRRIHENKIVKYLKKNSLIPREIQR